jgi:cell division protein FtsB
MDNNLTRFIPAFDTALLLILVIFGTIGMMRFTQSNQDDSSYDIPREEAIDQLHDLHTANTRMDEDIKIKTRQITQLIDELAGIKENVSDPGDVDKNGMIGKLRQEEERLKNEIDNLENDIDTHIRQQTREDSQEDTEKLRKRREELTRKLNECNAKNEELRKEIEKAKDVAADPNVLKVRSGSRTNYETTRQRLDFAVKGNNIIPVYNPYYKFYTVPKDIHKTSANVTVGKPDQPGESVDKAFEPNSIFNGKYLSKFDMKKYFVCLLVDPNGYEAFYKLRNELEKRNIPYGWEPQDTSAIIFTTQGGISVGESNRGS